MLNIIRALVDRYPEVTPYLNDNARKAAAGYTRIRAEYWVMVYGAVDGYLEGDKPVTAFRNSHAEAMTTAFTDAVYLGYEETSGESRPDEETLDWLSEKIGQERQNIDAMFARLKETWDTLDPLKEAGQRADGYARGLDGVYNEAKLRGSRNQMVTWVLGRTEAHCPTCQKLAGKKHRLAWLIKNDYIPRKPGAAMDCNGYNCDCTIVDKNGNEITL